jgi:rod shape-determining protein MreC
MQYNGDTSERSERRQFFIAGAFLLVALIALSFPPGVQQQVAAGLRLTVLHPFVAMQRSVTGARLRAAQVSELRSRLDSMVAVLSVTGSLAEENRRLRGILELKDRLGPGFLPASVIRSGTPGSESVFLLDVGAEDGVGVNAPILVREGLVGKVIEVRARESIAMDWSHPDFRASAMTADGRVFGLVEPDRGAFREADRLLLNGIAFYSELPAGTRVVASGRGGIFPRGVAIGTVVELNAADPRWHRSYWLRPAARPGSAIHVLVAVGDPVATGDLSSVFVLPPDPEGDVPSIGESIMPDLTDAPGAGLDTVVPLQAVDSEVPTIVDTTDAESPGR